MAEANTKKGASGGQMVGGQLIEANLRNGSKRVGRLWCMEREAGVCILDCPQESASSANTLMRLIRISHVKPKGFKVTSPPAAMGGGAGGGGALKAVALPPADEAALGQRYRDAVARQQKRVAQIGRNVSDEAQHVFDNLSKTLDCRWKDKDILVNHLGVRIREPYRPANVSGKDQKAKQRVQMMLAKFIESFKELKA